MYYNTEPIEVHGLPACPDLDTVDGIIPRALGIFPSLFLYPDGTGNLRVLQHDVGFYLLRQDGPRVERQTLLDTQMVSFLGVQNCGAGCSGC